MDFPFRRPQTQSGFPLVVGNGEQNFARDGNDERHDHNGEHQARGKKADPVGRALKQRQESESVLERGLHLGAHQGHENEHSEQAIDNAGYRRQQVDQKSESVGKAPRRKFRQENGGTYSERHGHEQSHRRGNQGSVDEGQRAKLVEDRIPIPGYQKMPAEFMPRQCRQNPITGTRAWR